MSSLKKVLTEPVFKNNPIGLQILGICSALAVTSKLETSIAMSIAVTLIMGISSSSVTRTATLDIRGSNSNHIRKPYKPS